MVGVERQAGPGQRAGAERRDVGRGDDALEPLDVAAERPDVREQMVREEHRLRVLQVRVAGHGDLGAGLLGARDEHLLQPVERGHHLAGRVRCVQSRRSVATWSLRLRPVWILAPASPGELGDPALDRGVDVLVGRREHEGVRRELGLDRVERGVDRVALGLGQQPDRREHRDVRTRAVDVVGREPAVERQALGQRHQRGVGSVGEPPVPERLAVGSSLTTLAHAAA